MLRKLLIVFASGLVLAVVALSGAWLAGGNQFREETLNGGINWNWGDGEEAKGPRITRSFTLEPGDRLTMAIPVDLEFRRGDRPGMTVEGPKEAIDRLVWDGGRLSLDKQGHLRKGLKVVIVAPEIGGLDLEAPAQVELRGLDQDELRLTAKGAVDVEAQGRVRRLFVDSEGAGNVDLSDVVGEDATVRIDGVGNVAVAATNLADVEINGAGNVSLKKRPTTVRTRINGVGAVDRDYED